MKADKIEINFIRGNHTVNTIEIEPEDIAVINEALKVTYNALSRQWVDSITGGFSTIANSIHGFEEKIKDLMVKIHD